MPIGAAMLLSRAQTLAETLAPLMVLVGCAGEQEAVELRLEGPEEVRVARYGPVDAPRVVLSDGSEPDGLAWSAHPETVAVVVGRSVEAVGPGTALVTGRWEQQTVSWTLVVQPAIALRFVSPPGRVGVGEQVVLQVQGRLDERVVEPGPLRWHTSDEAVLAVHSGLATGRAAGTAYVTAESVTGSRATVQLQVVELVTLE